MEVLARVMVVFVKPIVCIAFMQYGQLLDKQGQSNGHVNRVQ
jgi:hypothetical protein